MCAIFENLIPCLFKFSGWLVGCFFKLSINVDLNYLCERVFSGVLSSVDLIGSILFYSQSGVCPNIFLKKQTDSEKHIDGHTENVRNFEQRRK